MAKYMKLVCRLQLEPSRRDLGLCHFLNYLSVAVQEFALTLFNKSSTINIEKPKLLKYTYNNFDYTFIVFEF